MANEKVDVVIVGAGASGSVYASVLAKAGKKVVLLDNGPDWQLQDLISSEFWGRRLKPAGAPIVLEGKHPFGYTSQAGWGVGGAALHYFANFYRAAVRAIDGSSGKTFGLKFAMLSPSDKRDFVNLMRQNKAEGWQGPAGPFVYNVLRSDAVDVVYGTEEGYEALGVPYMAHIAPERRW